MIPGLKTTAPYLIGAVLVYLWITSHNERVRELALAEHRAAEASNNIRILKPEVVVLVKTVRDSARSLLRDTQQFADTREAALRALDQMDAPDSLTAPVVYALEVSDELVKKCVVFVADALVTIKKQEQLILEIEKERDAYKDLQPTTWEKVRSAGTWALVGGLIMVAVGAITP